MTNEWVGADSWWSLFAAGSEYAIGLVIVGYVVHYPICHPALACAMLCVVGLVIIPQYTADNIVHWIGFMVMILYADPRRRCGVHGWHGHIACKLCAINRDHGN